MRPGQDAEGGEVRHGQHVAAPPIVSRPNPPSWAKTFWKMLLAESIANKAVVNATPFVIAHPGKAGSCSGIFVASTKRSTSSTGARLAFAVLTRERNAA